MHPSHGNINNLPVQDGGFNGSYASQQAPPRPPHHHSGTYQHQNPSPSGMSVAPHSAMHQQQTLPQRPLSQNMGPLHVQASTNMNKVGFFYNRFMFLLT